MTERISSTASTELEETELFSLAALRLHDVLDTRDFAVINNMDVGTVRVSLEVLEGFGLISRTGNLVTVPILELPAVGRTLKRRHYSHW